MTSKQASCGLAWAAYALPAQSVTVPELARRGLITSTPRQLAQLGFKQVYLADGESAYTLAESAVEKILATSKCDPRDIDVLIHASALGTAPARVGKTESLFRYPATALQYRFGLTRATVLGVAQAGCVSLLTAIRLAQDMIASEPGVRRVLCVSSDVLPKRRKREILYNLISDGAAAVIVERQSGRNQLISYSQVTKGVLWESDRRGDEIVAAYFSTARTVMQDALKKARLRMSDIAIVLPHNVNRKSWQILGQLMEIPAERLFRRNISAKGHTIAADNVINLCDASRSGRIRSGDHLMFFSFGFGAHWACAILRH